MGGMGNTEITRIVGLIGIILIMFSGVSLAQDDISEDSMMDLSLEDLLDIEVTSVSKRAQPLHDAAAAIFVITNEDLKKWGVTNIPDALRQVPGLHVGRIDSNKWAVTARGYNGRFSNKLLVLVDGRSVYTSAFSGVYWEVQDMMLEDVDRIEIIRGPGSTLWGANAVNGVINIITKHAADTVGGLAVVGAGDYEKGFGSLRYGTAVGKRSFIRFFGKGFERGSFEMDDGSDAEDTWNQYRGGFRFDSQIKNAQTVKVQGEIYDGQVNQVLSISQLTPPYRVIQNGIGYVSGGHLLTNWTNTFSPTSALSVSAYFDRAVREERVATQKDNQVDLDIQHHFHSGNQTFVWGLGYRHTESQLIAGPDVMIKSNDQTLRLFNAFVQDEISLFEDKIALTLGSKFEHNDYTGLEIQPSVRVAWKAHDQHRLWGAASRAVRTPMRAEDHLEVRATVVPAGIPTNPGPLPLAITVIGSNDFEAEELTAYELGYRYSQAAFSADLATFYHNYTKLQDNRTGEPVPQLTGPVPYLEVPSYFTNGRAAASYGLEAALAWKASSWMRWNINYSHIQEDKSKSEGNSENLIINPKHQVSVNLGLNLPSNFDVNLMGRYVDSCRTRSDSNPAGQAIESFSTMDASLVWRFADDWQLFLVGQNLVEPGQWEYKAESVTLPSIAVRSFYTKLQLNF